MKKNEFIVVSGGTSNIGKEIIYKLVKRNNIIFTYNKSLAEAKKIIKKVNSESSNYAVAVKLDLFKKKDIDNLYKFIKKKNFFIKAFVHNAFIGLKRKNFLDLEFDQLNKHIVGNCLGSFLLTKVIIKAMQKGNGPSSDKTVTFISSQAAEYGGYQLTPYSASKGFLNSFSNSLSKEYSSHGIRSNVLSLGKFKTKQLMSNFNWNVKKATQDIPLGYLGEPKAIADFVDNFIYNSSYLSGANIKISGGR